jgi:hypothetical protein
MKNYTSQKNAINKYYNERVKYVKKAESFHDKHGVLINNPTKKDREKEIANINKQRARDLKKLDMIAQADTLKYIEVRVEWKKSATWGHNPHAEAWTSGGYYNTGKASGCGYCKESAAIGEALADSLSLQRFIIENLSKLKDEYGIELRWGLAHLSIGGKGVSTLLNIFKRLKGWTINEMHGQTFDGYRIERKK